MVIGKCEDVLGELFDRRGGRRQGVTWKYLSMEKCIMREENFHEGGTGFSSII